MNSREQQKKYLDHLRKGRYAACRFTNDKWGDWRLHEVSQDEMHLPFLIIQHLLTGDRLEKISIDDIAWRGMDFPSRLLYENCYCCKGQSYKYVDIDYPPILLKGTLNPYKKLYRVIDGKHRIMKMISMGLSKSSFYVLELSDIEKYLVHSLQFVTRFLSTDDDYTIKHYDILKKNYENLLNTCHD